MQNESFYKVKRDEIELKKSLDDLKLKFKRSQDEVNKFKQKEDELANLESTSRRKNRKKKTKGSKSSSSTKERKRA
jgi:hypothetical protein